MFFEIPQKDSAIYLKSIQIDVDLGVIRAVSSTRLLFAPVLINSCFSYLKVLLPSFVAIYWQPVADSRESF